LYCGGDMGNILIGWPNRVDSATLSGGSWQLPLNNLKNRDQWVVARSTDLTTTNTVLNLDLGTVRNIRTIALVNHNLSKTATWKISLGTTLAGAEVYTSSWNAAWTLTFDENTMQWEDVSVWEGIVDDDFINYPYIVSFVLPDWYNVRYVRIEINDTANTEGYIEIGRLFVGGGFTPKYNAEYGLQDSWEDKSEIVESISGATLAVLNRRYRKVQFVLPMLAQTEADIIHELQRRQGLYGEVLYIPDISDQSQNQRYGMLGRLSELSPIEYPYYKNRNVAFVIKEL